MTVYNDDIDLIFDYGINRCKLFPKPNGNYRLVRTIFSRDRNSLDVEKWLKDNATHVPNHHTYSPYDIIHEMSAELAAEFSLRFL